MDLGLAVWALRNARLHAPVPSHRLQTHVSSRLLGHEEVHRAQVGRWESGNVAVTYERVRRYEDLLGYPEGMLQCTIDALHRARQPIRSEPLLAPAGPVDVRATSQLLEQALSEVPMTGLDWYRLSSDLGSTATAILRRRDWRALFERCLLELAVSLNLEYALREEALARLCGHPQSGPVVAELAAAVLRDPHAQVYNDTATLLMYCADPDATSLLLETLRSPLNNDALRAALLALTSVMHASTSGTAPALSSATVGVIARHALEFVKDGARPLRVRRQAANLLRALQLPTSKQLAHGLHRHDMTYAATILLDGRALERQRLRAMGTGIRESLEAAGSLHADPVLDGLVRTALEDSDDYARSAAVRVLMLVPQRPVIARALTKELWAYRVDGDSVGVQECLELLVSLACAGDLDEVVEMLVAENTSPEVALLCGITVGNAPDPDDERAASRQQAIHARAARHITSRPAVQRVAGSRAPAGTGLGAAGDGGAEDARQLLRGLVYALGISGRLDLVAELRDGARRVLEAAAALGSECDGNAAAATAALGICDWWLALPEHVRPAAGAAPGGLRRC